MSVISASGSGYSSAAPGPTPAGQRAASNPVGGAYSPINGTQDIPGAIISVPNDGNIHVVLSTVLKLVTVNEAGGAIVISFTTNGQAQLLSMDPGTEVVGQYSFNKTIICDPGTVAKLRQNSALTAGNTLMYWALATLL